MEIDDFKKSNNMGNNNESNKNIDLKAYSDQVIESIINYIKLKRKKSLMSVIFLITLTIIYISVSRSMDRISAIGYLLCASGFVLGAIYFYAKYKSLPRFYYMLPVLDFINKAESKIKFMNLIDWLIIIPILLILGTGGGIIFITRLSIYFDAFSMLLVIWIVFFILLVVFGSYESKKLWEKEYGSLFNNLQNLKQMFNE